MAEKFDWDSSGLDKKKFTALANLLAFLFNKIAGEKSLSHENEGYDTDSISIAAYSESYECHSATSHDHGELKIQFLDCLAELVGNVESRPSTCTSMDDREKGVTIWATKAGGFKERDIVFLNGLANLLGCLASANKDEKKADDLWTAILGHYAHEIESQFIPDLKYSLEECKEAFRASADASFSVIRERIETLNKVVFENSDPHLKAMERHRLLVEKAYALREDESVCQLLMDSADANARTRSLWSIISLLGGLQAIFRVFKNICQTVPGFKAVTINPIPYDKALERPIEKPLNLEQTLQLLGLQLDSSTIAKITRGKCLISKAQEQFDLLQKQVPSVHAEMQMMLYFSTHGRLLRDLFPYLGCNQLSCFMCTNFLEFFSYSRIPTRGCDVALLQPWSVPELTELTPGGIQCVPTTLRWLEDCVISILKRRLDRKSMPLDAWVANETSSRDEERHGLHEMSDLMNTELHTEQGNVTKALESISLEQGATMAQIDNENPALEGMHHEEPLRECNSCSRLTTRTCSVCNKGNYCSLECEKERSKGHRVTCTESSLISAHHLFECLMMNTIPERQDVVVDFGFNHFWSFEDRSNLLGLYQGLYRLGVPAEAIHKWQVEGSLVANIKSQFLGAPKGPRGGYFSWFLEKVDVLQKDENVARTSFDRAHLFLEKEDQKKELADLQPQAKMKSFHLLVLLCRLARPKPRENAWFDFGFCACSDEEEENLLVRLYSRLLFGSGLLDDVEAPGIACGSQSDTATFSNFWYAYESGKLIELMDARGLASERKEISCLEAFLSRPDDEPRPTIWSLKKFLAIDDPAKFPVSRPVGIDYGFENCQTMKEMRTLMDIYKSLLLKADPLDLHEACLEGKLFEFAQWYVEMDEGHRRLMENPYPLEPWEDSEEMEVD
ncbi:uncharacterized protein LDX57_011363 [Aspergillus melleus]|uniref:uncharacterized protein n=1 Tax=Aspergillus melleus TaxID=138277 RepID=UPI001E8EAAB8|nr:uncharacterized protein LDX57_011363 [Aspergillus melleus]KAH8433729.1 hypothetical protein LDX57_011363 [Aspergillus melleus]